MGTELGGVSLSRGALHKETPHPFLVGSKADEVLSPNFQAVDRWQSRGDFIRQLKGNGYLKARLLYLECLVKVGSLNRFIEVHDCL